MNKMSFEQIKSALESFDHAIDVHDPRAVKQRRIVDAAARLFEHYGYRKTSMSDVARAAGVAKGTVYLYFKSKAELVVQVIVEEKKRHLVELKPVFEAASPVERLKKWMDIALSMGTRMPITSRLMTGDADILGIIEEIDTDTRDKSDEFTTAFIAALVSDAAAPHRFSDKALGEMAQVLKALFYFSGRMMDPRLIGDMTPERFASVLSQMLVHGVAQKGIPAAVDKGGRS